MQVDNLESIRIKLASPEDILSWSHGEVIKSETINYRTQKAEKDGLFCERIFGPEKDYECSCGKYKRIRYKGVTCDRCGVEVTKSQVRRERMGHIKLAVPVSHIWFLRGVPSRMGMVLNKPSQQLEKVIYFSSYIITKINEQAKKDILEEIEKEYKRKIKKEKTKKQALKQAKEKVEQEISNIKPLKILSEAVYRDLSLKYGEIFEAGTGSEVLRSIFESIDLKKIIQELTKEIKSVPPIQKKRYLKRLNLIRGMIDAKIRPEWMFLNVLPVLPPDLRPMVQLDGGRYASSDLNDLYRRVINRNNRLKYLLEISAPEVIIRNEKRMLQEAVDALIDNDMRKGVITTATTGGKRLLKSLADMLEGKQGRFRQNLLGKRVDYSGRSVISVGPELKLYQCGLPKTIALEIFKPFVIKKVLDKELAYNIRGATRLIEEKSAEIWAILEEIIKDKLVLLNRAPTLHRMGIQAFQPVLTEGETIKIHPLVCEAFNADFDGDQMAVYLPLSQEAQKEARENMLPILNLLRPATGWPIIGPYRDIALGCYYLTQLSQSPQFSESPRVFSDSREAILAHESGFLDLREKIKLPDPKSKKPELIETSVGRLLFNETLPEDYPYLNRQVDSKFLKRLIGELIERYKDEQFEKILDSIKDLGFEYATLSGISWGMDDLVIPKEKKRLIEEAEKNIEEIDNHFKRGLLSKEEKSSQKILVWQGVKSKIEKLLKEVLPVDGSVFSIVDSGSRGSWAQPVQMAGMKGMAINPVGEIIELPIISSFKEGFNVLEYFISTHGARKGTADTALRTSTAGYLTRRLVDVGHDVIITKEDCGDSKGMLISQEEARIIEQDFSFKIVGRVCLDDLKKGKKILVKKGDIIDWGKGEQIKKEGLEKVRVRSPLSCNLPRGICQKCYGWDLGKNRIVQLGQAVGIMAAQSIGEPGTQLTLRTFHLGGVAGTGDITQGLPRVEEIFEARPLREETPISLTDGKVIDLDQENRIIKIETGLGQKKKQVIEYKIPTRRAILVVAGQEVKKGEPLCEGSLDLKKLFKVAGVEKTQRYIIKEIQQIYVSQGVDIHDKHIEIMIYKMFSRVKIKEEGDSRWLQGEIAEKASVQEESLRLKKEKKKPPLFQQILLGISEVSLSSDSFLSAASFQQTSRVLIKAALEGKEDKLRGLKENVIIGKLVPVGTGFKKS